MIKQDKKKLKKKIKKSDKRKVTEKCDELWGKIVRSRDQHCIICGKSDTLQAHHIISRKKLATRYDLRNGVTLCVKDHIYGVHRDTVVYADKLKEHIGEDVYTELLQTSQLLVKDDLDFFIKKLLELQIKKLKP